MKLEINNSHKKAKINNLKPVIKPIVTTVFGGILSITLLTGCCINVTDKNIELNSFDFSIMNNDEKHVHIMPNHDFLVKSIEELENKETIKYLSLTSSIIDEEVFNEENFGFLRNHPLKKLELCEITINPSFLESLGSIEELVISCNEVYKYNIDYSKINNLKKISFRNLELYDYPIFLTNELINKLNDKGVEINLNGVKLDTVVKLNNSLDEIVSKLPVTKDSTDIEKLNAILVWILDSFYYDEQVSYYSSINKKDPILVHSFYANGELDAVYNNNGNIICGNYSALFQALANRLELTSYYVDGTGHAWNMVCFKDEKYYVDSTWLDTGEIELETGVVNLKRIITPQELIKSGEGNRLKWYLKDINEIGDDSSHQADYIPSNSDDYVEYVPINNEITEVNDNTLNIDLSEYLYKIVIDGEEYIANAATVLGILISLGLAVKVVKKFNKEEEKERKITK